MTFIFVFPIKNAWVCVADRLVTGTHESITQDGQEVILRIENKTKLESLSNNLIIGGAGNIEILDLAKDILERNGIDNFRNNIANFVSSQFQKFGRLETEIFVLDQKNQRCIKFDLDEIRRRPDNGCTDIIHCDTGYLGFTETPTNLDNATAKLLRRENYTYKKNQEKPFLKQCVEILEDISKNKLSVIGHPSIDGCNIWIVGKQKIRKYFVYPKDYDIREQND